ncbi:MAG TPA: class I SAM-dependent methyltransferase [Vicinamibacterales bacterium]|nr:class I SAM-dependent methyltransferase [Vicinamibacterales bacterium]
MTTATDETLAPPELSADLRDYLGRISRPESPELVALRERTAAMPFVSVMEGSPQVGRLLQFLIRLTGARNVLELGVFTGCSTLAMATALPPGGTVVAMDVSERWAAIGREFWARSGCDSRIDLRIGPADAALEALLAEGRAGTFDLAFVDANKDGYGSYFERCLALLRSNGVMVFDNILFAGRVHPAYTDARIRAEEPGRPKSLQDCYISYAAGLRRFNDTIAADDRVDLVVLPMLDGVTLARKV